VLVTSLLGPSLTALLPASGRLPARTILQVGMGEAALVLMGKRVLRDEERGPDVCST
jgi:hypothetical protein